VNTRNIREEAYEPFLEELTLFNEKDKCLSLLTSLKKSQKSFAWKALISMTEYILRLNNKNKYLVVEDIVKEALSLGPKAILLRETETAERFYNLYHR